jgi:hypothetical protein
VVTMLTSRGGGCQNDVRKPKEAHSKPPASHARPAQKALVIVISQQAASGRPIHKLMLCCLGANVCQELHQLEKYGQFKKMSSEQQVVKVNELRLADLQETHHGQGLLPEGQGRVQRL